MPQMAPHMADRALSDGPGRHDLTLDATLQRSLEDLASRYMMGRDERLSVALMLVDHQTGEILASVGSPDYTNTAGQGFVDMTQAQRSPGSTLKPLVYGLAFDRGLAHPETLILDTPVHFGGYAPQNFDGEFRGELSVRRALQLSLNIPVIRLTEALGPAHLMAALKAAGLEPGLQGGAPGLALALGGVGLSLEEMVQLYTGLARGGDPVPLTWRMGRETTAPPTIHRILSRSSAWQVGNILADVTPPASAGPPGRVAYKTGTSYGHRDAWALGWTGQHVAGVWIGRPDGTSVPGAFGGALAAPLLFEALGRAEARFAPLPPPPPETLLVSRAQLPDPLQRFGPREAAPDLQVTFPPEGTRLAINDVGIPIKLRGGLPPYTLLADGAVLATGLRRPEFLAPMAGPGFTTLSVVDAAGASGRVTIELR
jgi:penicillin-binding protein 1C